MNQPTDPARELLAQQRHQDDLRHEAMLERSEEELHETAPSPVEEKARAAMANKLHEEEHRHEAMLERGEEEVQGF